MKFHDADFLKRHSEMADDLIIVHIRILKPEIDILDVKYTIFDKLANFGGNFGIFSELKYWLLTFTHIECFM